MDARSVIQRIITFFFVAVGFSSAVFAGPTFIYGRDFNLQIPAEPDTSMGCMSDAVIEVPHHFTILDIDVGINLTHTNVFDLQIFVQSPLGTRICLNMYDFREFFKGANYVHTIFDDEAEIPIEEGEAPFAGRFRPKAGNLLEVFDGENAYGLWRLQIYDAYYHDTGTLDSFELIISIPEPATAVLLALGTGFAALLRPHRRR